MNEGHWILSDENLELYLQQSAPSHHVLSEAPRCDLFLDPGRVRFELTAPVDGAEPDLATLERVRVDTVTDDDGERFRLTVDGRDVAHEAYGLIVGIVAAMRNGMSFAEATAGAVGNFKAILALRRRLSTEVQVGLIGELLTVHTLLQTHAESDVFDWWLGPEAEQHDFAFPRYDVEVKTSTSEKREHVIHGLDQLQPNPGRELWLLSYQLTRGGGSAGISLTGLVGEIEGRLRSRLTHFQRHLEGLGWRWEDADLYRESFMPRHESRAFLVDDDFPALTSIRLRAVVPHASRVSGVSYRVDISDRLAGDPGGPVSAALNRTEFGIVS